MIIWKQRKDGGWEGTASRHVGGGKLIADGQTRITTAPWLTLVPASPSWSPRSR